MVTTSVLVKRQNETADDYLYRIGSLKDAGVINLTWPQLAVILNTEISDLRKPLTESSWRKKYQQLVNENEFHPGNENNIENIAKDGEYANNDNLEIEQFVDDPELVKIAEKFDKNKETWRVRDERYAIGRIVRSQARSDALLDLFRTEIKSYSRKDPPERPVVAVDQKKTAVYALLSDVHYGISFTSSAGSYNSDIANDRVMAYADKICEIGEKAAAQDCYVSLLGDMISGVIHAPIRIENRENAVEQVIGVSELVARFLHVLSSHFARVYVNSVSGNHSRIDVNAEHALRAEKLDSLIPWYCRARLKDIENVFFVDNVIDPTVCSFNIFGRDYVGVHGDMDKDLQRSAACIEKLAGCSVDYMLAGHLHVPNVLLQDRGYIRNGSVCGSGDDYTMRNRLFSNPYQICMLVSDTGVDAIYPVQL